MYNYRPWLGEVELPNGPNENTNPIAIGNKRYMGGANYVYTDGHAKLERSEYTRVTFPGHLLVGEHQTF